MAQRRARPVGAEHVVVVGAEHGGRHQSGAPAEAEADGDHLLRPERAQVGDHLDEIESRPDEMQERLDDLGEGIESARRQAESDDLLPEGGGDAGDRSGEGSLDDLDWPEGDEDRETPVGDDFHPGGT